MSWRKSAPETDANVASRAGFLAGSLLRSTADNGVDVLVLEHDLDGETVLNLLKRRISRQLLLARSWQHPTVQFAQLGSTRSSAPHRSAAVTADVLLHLVEDDQRRRYLAIAYDCTQESS